MSGIMPDQGEFALNNFDMLSQMIKALTDLFALLVALVATITSFVVVTKKLLSTCRQRKHSRRKRNTHSE
jgi:hypothetical protein